MKLNDDEWQRLSDIQNTLQEVSSGNFSARLQQGGRTLSGDRLTHLEDSVNETLDRAEELLESLRVGTRVLVHEMKYPFIAARSWMNRAREKMPPSAFRDELDRLIVQIDEARASAEIMADISLQIADRNDRSGFIGTNLRDVCEDVVVELSAFIKGRDQFVRAELSGAHVLGREHLLVIAVRNLLHNACSHSPIKSQVTIRCGVKGRTGWIEVEDCGPGMPEDVRGEILNSRSIALAPRVSRAASAGGLGLGLRLSSAIFRRHQAVMTVRDRQLGPGTTFHVEMPLL